MSVPDGVGDDGWVNLSGGPNSLPHAYQHPSGQVTDLEKIAVAHYGRHEHFERTGEFALVDERLLPVFRWTYSTKIAE
ncbi:DUF5988 family protein [Streptomyces sp. G1]|uniref:DUF5988 family protein n=1 Tax=Streptomyces sp. G1 TaxID=361572 RepID=UPI002030C6C1|nr:DUF5988 family protein [Streptomyces sp. G1]MCM1969436.1 DUF5988 family protein [Streptomyces sp. G1]